MPVHHHHGPLSGRRQRVHEGREEAEHIRGISFVADLVEDLPRHGYLSAILDVWKGPGGNATYDRDVLLLVRIEELNECLPSRLPCLQAVLPEVCGGLVHINHVAPNCKLLAELYDEVSLLLPPINVLVLILILVRDAPEAEQVPLIEPDEGWR